MTTLDATWPPASWQRRVIAVYLDYLLFEVVWVIPVVALGSALPMTGLRAFAVKLLLFALVEACVYRVVRWSPGHWLLGSVWEPVGERRVLVVDPWLKSNERWWTMLFGVFSLLNGTKSLVRWTLWTAPIPFMGFQLGGTVSVLVLIISGALECALGMACLRLRPSTLPLGAAYYGIGVLSTVLSWRLLPTWIEAEATARRAYQGVQVRPEEIEAMQSFLPIMMIVMPVVLIIWLMLVSLRIRKAWANPV